MKLAGTLEALSSIAHSICCEVEAFQPSIILALAHGGSLPAHAAQVLWQATRAEPFPLLVRTNLGREKTERYYHLLQGLQRPPFHGEHAGDAEVGHFLAWTARQSHWQAELREQVAVAMGSDDAPARVLVCDDCIYDGHTWMLALGLVAATFPTATVRFMAGAYLRDELAEAWLNRYHPGLHQKIKARVAAMHPRCLEAEYERSMGRLVLGTEDVDPESLGWQPLTARSERVRTLGFFLPPAEWMKLPEWANAVVADYVRWRARKRFPQLDELPDRLAQGVRIDVRTLSPGQLICCHIWLHGPITVPEAAVVCRLDEGAAEGELQRLVGRRELMRRGRVYDLPRAQKRKAFGPALPWSWWKPEAPPKEVKVITRETQAALVP